METYPVQYFEKHNIPGTVYRLRNYSRNVIRQPLFLLLHSNGRTISCHSRSRQRPIHKRIIMSQKCTRQRHMWNT